MPTVLGNPERGGSGAPDGPGRGMGDGSVAAVLDAPGNPAALVDAVTEGRIRGVVVTGCHDPGPASHGALELTRHLIDHDVLVLATGCAAVANARAGRMVPGAAALAGPGLRSVCEALGIPPVLHLGSGADGRRVVLLAAALAHGLGVGLRQLPLARTAPGCGEAVDPEQAARRLRRHLEAARRGLGLSEPIPAGI